MSVAYAPDQIDPQPAQLPQRVPSVVQKLTANIGVVNLAEDMDASQLGRIGSKVVTEYQIDEDSRADWLERNKHALKLAMQIREAKTYPWVNAANIKYPLITVAAIQFNARAYPAIVDSGGVVKAKVLGEPSDEKQAKADRIAKFMSYQLLEEMDGWEEDTDRLLTVLPILGTVVRKTYFDPVRAKNCSHLVMPEKFVVNYWTKDLDSCPRATEIVSFYPHEIEEKIRAGLWLEHTYGQAPTTDDGRVNSQDEQAPHDYLEQYRLIDLDEDGYPEPYIVTVHKETETVVRVYARYEENGIVTNAKGKIVSIKPTLYHTKYGFIPSMDGGWYDIGFGSLLNSLNETINSTINQLMDAGHLQNMQGGFIGAGVSMKSGALRFSPGEWKRVETSGPDLKASIVPLPTSMPSPVLFQLLGMLIEAARDITATKDILTGETQQANQPVGTTLAMIEQGLKVFTAIYKRVHRSLRHELGCLFDLNATYLNPQTYFAFQDTQGAVAKEDFDRKTIDVIPVSDPTTVSDMQRLGRAQFLLQFRGDPLMDGKEIMTRVLEAASIPDVKDLFAPQQAPDPKASAEFIKLDHDKRRLDIDERRLQLDEAIAKAGNTNLYATALATTSGIGEAKAAPKGLPGQPQPATPANDPAAAARGMGLMTFVHGQAVQEIEEGDSGGQVQQGDVPGMAGPSPDGSMAPVPNGQPVGAGPAVDGGGGPIPGAPDQGGPDGRNGDPGMGSPGGVLQPAAGA